LKEKESRILDIVGKVDVGVYETREQSHTCAVDDLRIRCVGRSIDAADNVVLEGDFEVPVKSVAVEDKGIDDCCLNHDSKYSMIMGPKRSKEILGSQEDDIADGLQEGQCAS
jgi:hypothetical protein